jgi:glucose dehydrogenase
MIEGQEIQSLGMNVKEGTRVPMRTSSSRHLGDTMKLEMRSVTAPRVAASTALLIALCSISIGSATAVTSPMPVDAARLANSDRDGSNWLSYGRTYSEQRYSPLARITADNASQLGLAWYADLDTDRGQEATPLVIDGVLYTSTAWSSAVASRTGAR